MPVFRESDLRDKSARIFTALGCPADEAALVADLLVESNLAGHDSHGVIRIAQYAKAIEDGHVNPGAEFEILTETPAIAVVDGHQNFGQVIMMKALEVALEKASHSAVSTIMVSGCNHIARLGSYADRAARRGFVCMIGVNAPGSRCVAPWGGLDRRMGTNPLCYSVPCSNQPLVLDMTTSVVAEGKLRVSHHKGQPVPPDWIIDFEGNSTTNTADFYDEPQGSLLPLGGSVGYKGFGLSVMLDIICGGLSGQGTLRPDLSRGQNGVWLNLWKVDAFVERSHFQEEIDRLTAHIRSSRLKDGVSEILLPGEIEAQTMERRKRDGIDIPDETWAQIVEVARGADVDV